MRLQAQVIQEPLLTCRGLIAGEHESLRELLLASEDAETLLYAAPSNGRRESLSLKMLGISHRYLAGHCGKRNLSFCVH